MKTIIAAAVLLSLAGCATSSKTYGPDGREAYTINCSGGALNWGQCYEKAGSICGARGYDILNKDTDGNSSIGATQHGLYGSASNSRSLVISCK